MGMSNCFQMFMSEEEKPLQGFLCLKLHLPVSKLNFSRLSEIAASVKVRPLLPGFHFGSCPRFTLR